MPNATPTGGSLSDLFGSYGLVRPDLNLRLTPLVPVDSPARIPRICIIRRSNSPMAPSSCITPRARWHSPGIPLLTLPSQTYSKLTQHMAGIYPT